MIKLHKHERSSAVFQRDVFIDKVAQHIARNSNTYFLSADFGAPALDALRTNFPKNFIHCGISEQAMIDMATGMALEGKKIFAYAMAPVISLRGIEQAKCGPGLMNLPICLMSVGVGLGYADAGPTHYATEDYACTRALVGSTIYTPADAQSADLIAFELIKHPTFSYVRLDREPLPNIMGNIIRKDIKKGYRIVGTCGYSSVALISHGRMVHTCMKMQRKEPSKYFVVDLFRSKPFPEDLHSYMPCRGAVVVDEQTPSGNLAAAVFEGFSEHGYHPKIVSRSLPERYIFENGGRDYLLNQNGLSEECIANAAKLI